MASPGNQHCASCIEITKKNKFIVFVIIIFDTLSFPIQTVRCSKGLFAAQKLN